MDVAVAAMARMAREDEPTFDAWLASRSTALARFAYLVTGNRHEAEDALQSALANACAKWSRVSRADDPEAYVRRMIVNAHVSGWRSFRRRETPVGDDRADRGGPDPAAGVVESDRVWRLCGALAPRQRAAVVLRFYEDLSYSHIATVLQCSESAARGHIYRALGALRRTLKEETLDG